MHGKALYLKLAVFQIGGAKSPGPDGFSGIFYHNYWNLIITSITTAAALFFELRTSSQRSKSDLHHPIPKKQSPET